MYIAHTKQNSDTVQTVKEHSLNTASMAETFAIEPFKALAYNTGLFHDIGKYQPSFQKRISGENIQVDHARCGAKEIFNNKNPDAILQAYCISGHHTGIPDGGLPIDNEDDITLTGLMQRTFEDCSAYKQDLPAPKICNNIISNALKNCTSKDEIIQNYAFLTRYIFSCLTDADSLDTAKFCDDVQNTELTSDFRKCLDDINTYIKNFHPVTNLQRTRSLLQEQVYSNNTDADIYLMNMPTGSGKTICSMKFALEKAIKLNKRRIIYVIPYNSIIDQTATIFENIFKDHAHILRHQSSYSIDDEAYPTDYKKLVKKTEENWNAQIIITTSVQFFESIYKNKRKQLRKFHNMANSIIIFDEAHMMPIEYLKPCLTAVAMITQYLNSKAVFLTATMPDFKKKFEQWAPTRTIENLVRTTTIFPMFHKGTFKNMEKINADNLISDIHQQSASLIVVNKRKTARELFEKISFGKKFHLSTYMTMYDRERVIKTIKKELEKLYDDFPNLSAVPDDRKIIVISTSLIEAGIDLDFQTVYRELSGLDHILQTGGRCNREGKRKNAEIKIFEFPDMLKHKEEDITENLLQKYGANIESVDCIREYYDRLYSIKKDKIENGCIKANNLLNIPFTQYSQNFNLIPEQSISVVINQTAECADLISNLSTKGYTDYRKLQKYTCSVYENELKDMLARGLIKEYNGIYLLTDNNYYDTDTGIDKDKQFIYII